MVWTPCLLKFSTLLSFGILRSLVYSGESDNHVSLILLFLYPKLKRTSFSIPWPLVFTPRSIMQMKNAVDSCGLLLACWSYHLPCIFCAHDNCSRTLAHLTQIISVAPQTSIRPIISFRLDWRCTGMKICFHIIVVLGVDRKMHFKTRAPHIEVCRCWHRSELLSHRDTTLSVLQ